MKLKVLDDTALRALTPEKLIALTAQLQRLIDTANAYQQRVITIAEQRKAARAVGDISIADSLVRATGISHRRARRTQRRARTIAAHPDIADALAAGTINTEQAETIARSTISDTTRTRLLETATAGESADTTRLRVTAAETTERDETPSERFMRQRSKRYLRFYDDRDGMVCMQGAMDPDTGARVKTRIRAIANHMWRQDKKQTPKHRRTPEQREIDALYTAITHPPHTPTTNTTRPNPTPTTNTTRPTRPNPTTNNVPPHPEHDQPKTTHTNTPQHQHNNTNPETTPNTDTAPDIGAASGVGVVSGVGVGGFHRRVQALPLLRVSTSLQDLTHGLNNAGVTDSGEHLAVQTLRRLACDAQIIPMVLNSKSRVIDVGRRTRVINEALRIAVIHRDKHCVWPGCNTPPDRCDCHHVEHWADGGPTTLDNLALLCHHHHILLHEGGYKLKQHNNHWTVNKKHNTHPHPHTTTPTPTPPHHLKPPATPPKPTNHQTSHPTNHQTRKRLLSL